MPSSIFLHSIYRYVTELARVPRWVGDGSVWQAVLMGATGSPKTYLREREKRRATQRGRTSYRKKSCPSDATLPAVSNLPVLEPPS